jgi:hypothetical protein
VRPQAQDQMMEVAVVVENLLVEVDYLEVADYLAVVHRMCLLAQEQHYQ